MFGRAAITLGIGPHSSWKCLPREGRITSRCVPSTCGSRSRSVAGQLATVVLGKCPPVIDWMDLRRATFNLILPFCSVIVRRPPRCLERNHAVEIFIIVLCICVVLLWSPYVIGQTIIFLPCSVSLLLSFFPCLISAAADWMSTILLHMAWP